MPPTDDSAAGQADAPPGWPGRFQDSNRLVFERPVTTEAAFWWHRRFAAPHGLWPLDMAERLTGSAPGEASYAYRYIDPVREEFDLVASGHAGSQRLWLHNTVLELPDAALLLDRIEVSASGQRRRVARTLCGATVGTAKLLDLSSVRVSARDVGGYVWARAGFLPQPGAWLEIAGHATRQLRRIERLSATDLSTAQALLADLRRDPSALNALARLNTPVPNPERREPTDPGTVPLGAALLIGSNWDGELPLAPGSAMSTFEEWLKT